MSVFFIKSVIQNLKSKKIVLDGMGWIETMFMMDDVGWMDE